MTRSNNSEDQAILKAGQKLFWSKGTLFTLLMGSFFLHGMGYRVLGRLETAEATLITNRNDYTETIDRITVRFTEQISTLNSELSALRVAELATAIKVIQTNISSINEKLAVLDRRQEKQEDWRERWMERTLSSTANSPSISENP